MLSGVVQIRACAASIGFDTAPNATDEKLGIWLMTSFPGAFPSSPNAAIEALQRRNRIASPRK